MIIPQDPATSPRVSVIIPCYNYGRFLSQAIESALAQTHSNLEIVIVDDGSTDDTAAVASAYKDRVVYHYQPNRGPSAARNTGIGLSSGQFLAFLDADDWLDPGFVAAGLQALSNHPEAAFAFPQIWYFGRFDGVSRFPRYDSVSALHRRIPVCAFFRRDAFATVRYDEGLRSGLEDLDLYYTLAERGAKGVLVDEPLVHCRIHDTPGSVTDGLIAAPHLRRTLHARLMLRHHSLFSVRDWAEFSYTSGREVVSETRHRLRRRLQRRRASG